MAPHRRYADRAVPLDRPMIAHGVRRVMEAFGRRLSRAPLGDPGELLGWLGERDAERGQTSDGRSVLLSQGTTMTPFYDVRWKDVRGRSLDIDVVPVLAIHTRPMGHSGAAASALVFDARPPNGLLFEASIEDRSHKHRRITMLLNVASPVAGAFVADPQSFFPLFEGKFLHELTHARDVIPSRAVIDPREDLHAYYNSSHEVRAFLQQILAEVLRPTIVRAGQRVALASRTPNARLVDEVLSHSDAWKKVAPYVSERNEQYIRKAVAQALRERDLLYERPGHVPMTLPRER